MITSRRTVFAKATAVAAAAVVGGLGFAMPASADPPGLQVVGESSTATSSDKTLTASCPANTVVTGGGGYLTTSASAQGFVALDRLEPLANGQGFTAAMKEVGAVNYASNWRFSALAVCATQPAGYAVVSTTGAAEVEYVTASCGAKSVIGMGGRVNGGSGNVVLDQVVPSFDLSSVTARGVHVQGSGQNGWSVTAFAVCANTPPGLERISLVSPYASDSHNVQVKACPAGKALYSAGADIGAGNGQVLLSGVNIAPSDTVRAWADEDGDGDGGTWNLIAYGICGS